QDIARAFRYFGEHLVTSDEREVFVALRNAFAHDFGLTHTRGGRRRVHKFVLTVSNAAPLVEFPEVPWNGRFGRDDEGGPTVVNLTRFTEYAERIIERLEMDAKNNALTLATDIS